VNSPEQEPNLLALFARSIHDAGLRDIQRILDIQPILPHQDFLDDAIKTHALTEVWSAFQRQSL
jgi:hypothetical protein